MLHLRQVTEGLTTHYAQKRNLRSQHTKKEKEEEKWEKYSRCEPAVQSFIRSRYHGSKREQMDEGWPSVTLEAIPVTLSTLSVNVRENSLPPTRTATIQSDVHLKNNLLCNQHNQLQHFGFLWSTRVILIITLWPEFAQATHAILSQISFTAYLTTYDTHLLMMCSSLYFNYTTDI